MESGTEPGQFCTGPAEFGKKLSAFGLELN
jgi:hypothetical protein